MIGCRDPCPLPAAVQVLLVMSLTQAPHRQTLLFSPSLCAGTASAGHTAMFRAVADGVVASSDVGATALPEVSGHGPHGSLVAMDQANVAISRKQMVPLLLALVARS